MHYEKGKVEVSVANEYRYKNPKKGDLGGSFV